MTEAISIQRQIAPLAIVHHANQYIITDGYDNRMGISEVTGTPTSATGLTRVLALHERYKVPLNLHISGTLLESLAWNSPDFFSRLEHLADLNLLELIGGSYGQNMMRFFSREHNLRQLREELRLYEDLLNWDPTKVTTAWITERLWETETLAPTLTDTNLQNGGYMNVLLDDRLLYSNRGNPSPRQLHDYCRSWDASGFQMYRIKDGNGLCVLPISTNLRRTIPPTDDKNFVKVKAQFHWLADINSHYENGLIAIYADDMEKTAGVGWDPTGPDKFETLLRWISENPAVQPVKLTEWTAGNKPAGEKAIDPGAYAELVNEFKAGETYDNWYFDPRWTPYRQSYTWSENKVRELESQGADPSLIDLAWKTLLATTWQTAWHTPQTGAHGLRSSDGGPSAWAKAIASHSRLAAIIAEAAYWMRHKDDLCHACLRDLDQDGNPELILTNDSLFAVFSPQNGGRLVYLSTIRNPPGRLVIGNPIDDWNLLEDLHAYMDTPPNHPGALSDVGFEHDNYSVITRLRDGDIACATLRNDKKNSPGYGIEKTVTLRRDQSTIRVDYALPESLTDLSTEIGFSPDYLQLLRAGQASVDEFSPTESVRGWVNNNVTVGVRLDGASAFWDRPRQDTFGHGFLLRVTAVRNFALWIGAED
jgi:glycosyl hydrolase family 57